jgi:glutathione S-transferase
MEPLSYEFKEIDIFNEAGATFLKSHSPINQIPVLVYGEQKIYDSRQIFNYLNLMHKMHNMDWNDENQLTAVEGAMNSAVSLLMLKRSGIDIDSSMMFIERQKQRIVSVMDHLKPYLMKEGQQEWNFMTMSLYAFLDWAQFRNLYQLTEADQIFLDSHKNRSIVNLTSIPRA